MKYEIDTNLGDLISLLYQATEQAKSLQKTLDGINKYSIKANGFEMKKANPKRIDHLKIRYYLDLKSCLLIYSSTAARSISSHDEKLECSVANESNFSTMHARSLMHLE